MSIESAMPRIASSRESSAARPRAARTASLAAGKGIVLHGR